VPAELTSSQAYRRFPPYSAIAYCRTQPKTALQSGRAATDRFHVVPIGIENERSVVVRMVVRSWTGLAIVTSLVGEGTSVEAVDQLPAGGGKCYVHPGDGKSFSVRSRRTPFGRCRIRRSPRPPNTA